MPTGLISLPSWGFFLQHGSASLMSDMLSMLTAPEIAITGAATATLNRWHVCSGTSADYTLTLPAVSGNTKQLIGVRMATGLTKFVTLDGNASELIDGALTRVLWAGESALLLCDGTGWAKVAGKSLAMAATIFLSANQTGIVTGTLTKILCNTSALDNTGLCVDTTNKRLTVKRPGVYMVSGSLPWFIAAAGARYITVLEASLSGGAVAQITEAEQGAYVSTAAPTSLAMTTLLMAAADYVELWGYQNSGSTQAATGGATLAAGVAYIAFVEVPQW